MAPNTKRVFYVNALSHQVYLEILAKRPDIQVDKLVNDSPEDEAERVLSHAHA
jgi:D-3-phosphoglycerate dehydrogenase